jgi:hypothetical protein
MACVRTLAIAVRLAGVRQLTAVPTTARVLTGVQF